MSGLSERDMDRLDYVVHATDCDFEDVVATVAAIRDEAKAEARPWANCDGSFVCESAWHVHGCYADDGQCDDPKDHHAGVRDEAKAEALLCSQCGEQLAAMVKVGTSDGWCVACLDEAAVDPERDARIKAEALAPIRDYLEGTFTWLHGYKSEDAILKVVHDLRALLDGGDQS